MIIYLRKIFGAWLNLTFVCNITVNSSLQCYKDKSAMASSTTRAGTASFPHHRCWGRDDQNCSVLFVLRSFLPVIAHVHCSSWSAWHEMRELRFVQMFFLITQKILSAPLNESSKCKVMYQYDDYYSVTIRICLDLIIIGGYHSLEYLHNSSQ